MAIVETLKQVVARFPSVSANREELERLQRFFDEAKRAGVVKIREYDLPLPDTIGRTAVQARRKVS